MVPMETLWCPNVRSRWGNGWKFPGNVRKLLLKETAGLSVLHLFGGLSTFGTRIDIDRDTKPDVVADAWLPPFGRDSFDVVVLDPPYVRINQQMKSQLLMQAAYIARARVYWFHTLWISGDRGCRPIHAWLIRVGDSCQVRCLQKFDTSNPAKRVPRPFFTRGPAIKYNRWLGGAVGLPFGDPEPAVLP